MGLKSIYRLYRGEGLTTLSIGKRKAKLSGMQAPILVTVKAKVRQSPDFVHNSSPPAVGTTVSVLTVIDHVTRDCLVTW